jgi:hypothetical protein
MNTFEILLESVGFLLVRKILEIEIGSGNYWSETRIS